VLYLSLHQDPRGFPGTGFIDDVGEHEGRGYTVNLPFPFRTPDKVYLKAFDHVVVPIARQYKPEFILVSVGFDGYYADPVGALSLSAHLYTKVFSKILNLASQSCNGKLVAILEGGYHLAALGRMTSSVIARLAGAPYTLKSKRSWQPSARVVRRAERVLDEVKRVQSMFWSFENS
jgi:acetoin utilization deacetylase AcuC-like enzyme